MLNTFHSCHSEELQATRNLLFLSFSAKSRSLAALGMTTERLFQQPAKPAGGKFFSLAGRPMYRFRM
jgi:hypothetical protein